MSTRDFMELEPSANIAPLPPDQRPLIPEPPPVRLHAVEDVRLPAVVGLEKELDAFYVDLLEFERDASAGESVAYRAENFRLRIEVVQSPVERTDYRAAI